jgi:hypothetical protein
MAAKGRMPVIVLGSRLPRASRGLARKRRPVAGQMGKKGPRTKAAHREDTGSARVIDASLAR